MRRTFAELMLILIVTTSLTIQFGLTLNIRMGKSANFNFVYLLISENYDVFSLWVNRYFTWDSHKFPHPVEMIQNISSKGRKMVKLII